MIFTLVRFKISQDLQGGSGNGACFAYALGAGRCPAQRGDLAPWMAMRPTTIKNVVIPPATQ